MREVCEISKVSLWLKFAFSPSLSLSTEIQIFLINRRQSFRFGFLPWAIVSWHKAAILISVSVGWAGSQSTMASFIPFNRATGWRFVKNPLIVRPKCHSGQRMNGDEIILSFVAEKSSVRRKERKGNQRTNNPLNVKEVFQFSLSRMTEFSWKARRKLIFSSFALIFDWKMFSHENTLSQKRKEARSGEQGFLISSSGT